MGLTSLGKSLSKLGCNATSVMSLRTSEKANQITADNPAAMDTLAWILLEQSKTARALGLLQKAVAIAPQLTEIRYHLAVALVKSGDKVQARKELELLLKC